MVLFEWRIQENLSGVKLIKYTIILLLIISLAFNYHLYYEKEDYIVQLGAENQQTVRVALHEIREGQTDYWITTLKEKKAMFI